ncbi:MAG: Asp-tRNA(Asn)/Glu-tRNA(Gln) amidotransferase subunit GatB [Bdellovibrionales bacterium]
MSSRAYETVIGIETHVQLKTDSKMFSPEATNFEAGDNENTSPVTLGMPGALPVVNKRAIDFSIKVGLALNCQIRKRSVFARKNYFYPDMPKGYQISQYDLPICEKGHVIIKIEGQEKKISITRAHMEEDAGKSTHHGDYTLINLNRAGIPLLEIVSEPEISSAREAAEYARTLRQIVRYLEVCDGNLEEGSLRCDVNVSVRPAGSKTLGTKVELKNLNSFRFIEKAVEFEVERQIEALESGEKIIQETRLYDPDKNRTYSMRAKEDAQDYRYFPDPDLLPVHVTDEHIEKLRQSLPELPLERARRFMRDHALPEYDANVLTAERDLADFYEETAKVSGNPKASSNWIMTEMIRELNQKNMKLSQSPISPANLGRLIQLIDRQVISGKIGKSVFAEMWTTGQEAQAIIQEKGLTQITDDSELEKIVTQILAANPSQVQDFKAGKTKILGYLVGAIMKATKGQANPEAVNRILMEKLKGP